MKKVEAEIMVQLNLNVGLNLYPLGALHGTKGS